MDEEMKAMAGNFEDQVKEIDANIKMVDVQTKALKFLCQKKKDGGACVVDAITELEKWQVDSSTGPEKEDLLCGACKEYESNTCAAGCKTLFEERIPKFDAKCGQSYIVSQIVTCTYGPPWDIDGSLDSGKMLDFVQDKCGFKKTKPLPKIKTTAATLQTTVKFEAELTKDEEETAAGAYCIAVKAAVAKVRNANADEVEAYCSITKATARRRMLTVGYDMIAEVIDVVDVDEVGEAAPAFELDAAALTSLASATTAELQVSGFTATVEEAVVTKPTEEERAVELTAQIDAVKAAAEDLGIDIASDAFDGVIPADEFNGGGVLQPFAAGVFVVSLAALF